MSEMKKTVVERMPGDMCAAARASSGTERARDDARPECFNRLEANGKDAAEAKDEPTERLREDTTCRV